MGIACDCLCAYMVAGVVAAEVEQALPPTFALDDHHALRVRNHAARDRERV